MNNNPIRVRYAPSPTGLQHPGGVRTALFAWLFAVRENGDFILRIEDTDKKRQVDGAIEYIYESLSWLGIKWTEGPNLGGSYGPYLQSERLDLYLKHAKTLLEKGLAYADPYSKEEVDTFRQQSQASGKPFLFRDYRPARPPEWSPGMPLRFKVPNLKSYSWEDASRGRLSAGPEALDDFVILKADGYPTYNFANVVDDHLMHVSHVLRGEEYIASIPKYLSLYEAFNWSPPINATMPLVLGPTGGKKLSKRDGSLPMLDYRDLGYLPEAMNNFLATLGWNDGSTQEIYKTEELLQKFELKRLQKAPARFDIERLNYLNGVHIRRLKLDELDEMARDFWPSSAADYDADYRKQVLSLIHERLKFLNEIPELTGFFFDEPKEAFRPDPIERTWLEQVLIHLQASDFEEEDLEKRLRMLADELKINPGKLFMAIRQTIAGSKISPGLFETLNVLGKDAAINRLKAVLSNLPK